MDNEQKTTIQILKEVEAEIRACFNDWDEAIKNGKQPVPIQDLDYWAKTLSQVIQNMDGE